MSVIRFVKMGFYVAIVSQISSPVFAGNYGTDLGLRLSPADAGKASTGYVRPQDTSSKLFGNPATLTQVEGETEFTFSGTYLTVNPRTSNPGQAGAGIPAFDTSSDFENFVMPSVAVAQRVNDDFVWGVGFQPVAGLASDFEGIDGLQPVVTYLTFGANFGAAYSVSDDFSIGGYGTLAYGLLEFGLVSNTSIKSAFGLRGGLGATYDLGAVTFGANYDSPLTLDFNDVTQTAASPNVFSDVTLEQPQTVVIGLATSDEFSSDWLFEINGLWKNWGAAESYEDFWEDQYIAQIGGQYNVHDALRLRAGYVYQSDLLKDDVGSRLGNLTSLAAGSPAATTALSPELVQLVQSTLTQPYWDHQISGGFGYDLNERMTLDFNMVYSFADDRRVGANTLQDLNLFSAGLGISWKF